MIKFRTHEEYLEWLDKFAEYGCSDQSEEKPAEYCLECGKPLYEDDTVFCFNDDDYYCENCIEECRTTVQNTERI